MCSALLGQPAGCCLCMAGGVWRVAGTCRGPSPAHPLTCTANSHPHPTLPCPHHPPPLPLRSATPAAIPSMLMGRGEQCSKQSATVVLASLSHSAREVFKLIAGAQLDHSGEQGEHPGLAAPLHTACMSACPPACCTVASAACRAACAPWPALLPD